MLPEARGFLLLGIAWLAGCGPAPLPERPTASGDSFQAREGRHLFASFCAPCHGEEGRGDGTYLSAGAPAAPPDFTSAEVRARIQRDAVATRLSWAKGLGERHCPAWGITFSAEDIEALAAFVEGLGRAEARAEAEGSPCNP